MMNETLRHPCPAMRSTTRSTASSPARSSARIWSGRSRSGPTCRSSSSSSCSGKYCASSDETGDPDGPQVVNDTLANNYIRPDESMKAQSRVKEEGRYTFIDKVKVRLVDSDYWAEADQFRRQVPPHPDPVRPRLRAASDGWRLGADRHALRVRRGGQGQEPVLDRQADADPDRDVRPRGVPRVSGPSSRRTSGSTS